MHFLFNILSVSVIIFLISRIIPAVHIKNFATAIIISITYSILNLVLSLPFTILSLPLIVLTLGLFKFIINAFLLWITDKLIDDFKIDGFGWTLLTAFLISIGSTLIDRLFFFTF
ncbi:MAG: phage holin family protein [Fibrobacter sp.]|nr:phage holin family protein [Fibrobacter sp.]